MSYLEKPFRGIDFFIDTVQDLKSMKKEDRPPVLVYGDPDIDGLVSMREFLLFLEKELEDESIPYYVNNNRSHGFFIPPEKLRGYYVFCVDFSIEQDKMDELIANGVNIVSVDHHECQETFISSYEYKEEELKGTITDSDGAFGFVINNQYPFEDPEWTFQSGMGVLYHCIGEYYRQVYNSTEYLDNKTTRALVGLTLLSDVRNIEMPEARQFLDALYTHPNEGYIGYLIESVLSKDYTFGLPCMDRNFVDYTFSPKINSLFRFNRKDLASAFILGYGYPLEDYQTLQREFVEYLEGNITKKEYPNITFIEIPSTGLSEEEKSYVTNFVGLLASRYVTSSNVVIAYYSDNGVYGRASFRGSIQSIDFRKELNKLGLDGRGHASAYGILNFQPSEQLFESLSKRCTELFADVKEEVIFRDVPHLSLWIKTPSKGYRTSKENCYLLNHHRIYLRYTGDLSRIEKKRGNDRYSIYSVDGIEVKCFNNELTFENGLILPMLEKGRPVLQLARFIDE